MGESHTHTALPQYFKAYSLLPLIRSSRSAEKRQLIERESSAKSLVIYYREI